MKLAKDGKRKETQLLEQKEKITKKLEQVRAIHEQQKKMFAETYKNEIALQVGKHQAFILNHEKMISTHQKQLEEHEL